MIWKTIFVAFFAVGVLADYEIPEEHRNKFKDAIKTQCEKSGASDKVTEVENSVKVFVDCIKSLFDVQTIQKEIEDAKPNGALDEVFKKYCAKAPQLKTCLHSLTAGVAPCLQDNVRQHIGLANNATDQLIDFLCYKDGDRIALFIAEAGPECFQAKSSNIRACAERIGGTISNAEDVKKMSLKQQCDKFDEMSTCVVKALEECETPTPGNMAESLFRFVKKSSPCKN